MKSILIIEDESSLQKILGEQLSKRGYRVLAAGDGKEGLRRATEEHPDLILLDLIMPYVDGLQMLGDLRKDAWGKSAAVIVLTNLNDIKARQTSTDLSALDYLVKSDWTMEEIFKKVDRLLQNGTSSQV